MNIYQCGTSIEKRIIGLETPTADYVCILDDEQHTLPIEQAFIEMCKNFADQGINTTSVDNKPYTVKALNGDKYTLAHERVIGEANIVCTPSNILRHIYTRQFTKDCLYIDDSNSIIDLTGRAEKDIRNRKLFEQTSFTKELVLG